MFAVSSPAPVGPVLVHKFYERPMRAGIVAARVEDSAAIGNGRKCISSGKGLPT